VKQPGWIFNPLPPADIPNFIGAGNMAQADRQLPGISADARSKQAPAHLRTKQSS